MGLENVKPFERIRQLAMDHPREIMENRAAEFAPDIIIIVLDKTASHPRMPEITMRVMLTVTVRVTLLLHDPYRRMTSTLSLYDPTGIGRRLQALKWEWE